MSYFSLDCTTHTVIYDASDDCFDDTFSDHLAIHVADAIDVVINTDLSMIHTKEHLIEVFHCFTKAWEISRGSEES